MLIKIYSFRFNLRVGKKYLVHEEESYPMEIIDAINDNEQFTHSMKNFRKHLHKEWIIDITEPYIIEPDRGLVFNNWGSYLYRSFNYFVLIDSRNFPFKSWLKVILRRPLIEYNIVFSLRDLNESNYWHFFDDELSKLRFFDQLDLDKDTPVLVGKNLWNTHFFQYVSKQTGFKKYNWVLHTDLIRSNRIIISVPSSLKQKNFEFFLERSDLNLQIENNRFVFVNRSLERGRTIYNFEVLKPILLKYNIQIVENDNLSFNDQINLYKDAGLIIGIHGAGLANLIYRINKNAMLFEIFHPNTIHPHYVWMCKTFNFKYDCIIGGEINSLGNFYVNPELFEQKLKRFFGL